MLDIGEDLDVLLLFCRCDMTTRNEAKRLENLRGIDELKAKIVALIEADQIRTFEPPVTGEDIMQYFKIKPCRFVGQIKNQLKDEILAGSLPNERDQVWERMIQIGQQLIKN